MEIKKPFEIDYQYTQDILQNYHDYDERQYVYNNMGFGLYLIDPKKLMYEYPYYVNVKDLYSIRNEDILRTEIYKLYNMYMRPIDPRYNLGTVHGINLSKYKDLDFYKNPDNKVFNEYKYEYLTSGFADIVMDNKRRMDNYKSSDVIAYHLRHFYPNTIQVTDNYIREEIMEINKHIARNFIVLTQTTKEPGLINPAIHFIISNAAYFMGNPNKMKYLLSGSLKGKIRYINSIQYPNKI